MRNSGSLVYTIIAAMFFLGVFSGCVTNASNVQNDIQPEEIESYLNDGTKTRMQLITEFRNTFQDVVTYKVLFEKNGVGSVQEDGFFFTAPLHGLFNVFWPFYLSEPKLEKQAWLYTVTSNYRGQKIHVKDNILYFAHKETALKFYGLLFSIYESYSEEELSTLLEKFESDIIERIIESKMKNNLQ